MQAILEILDSYFTHYPVDSLLVATIWKAFLSGYSPYAPVGCRQVINGVAGSISFIESGKFKKENWL
jgi:hypothetical protein